MIKLKPGIKIRVNYGPNNINNCLLHIRAVVDDYYIVTRRWVKHKKRWAYEIKDRYFFEMLDEQGCLEKTK